MANDSIDQLTKYTLSYFKTTPDLKPRMVDEYTGLIDHKAVIEEAKLTHARRNQKDLHTVELWFYRKGERLCTEYLPPLHDDINKNTQFLVGLMMGPVLRTDEIVWVADAWVGSSVVMPDHPDYVRPSEDPDRKEAMIITFFWKDEMIIYVYPYTKDENNYFVFGDSFERKSISEVEIPEGLKSELSPEHAMNMVPTIFNVNLEPVSPFELGLLSYPKGCAAILSALGHKVFFE